jgi:glycosyltransferase involved in cell wall biosynthesis
MRGRILVVDYRTPTPDQDGGSASTFSYLKILADAGYRVTFVPSILDDAGRYSQALRNLGIRTVAAPEWTSIESAVEHLAPRSDVLLLYRAPTAARVFDLARRAAPNAKILFHPVDLHFLRMQRAAALTGDPAEAAAAQAIRTVELDLIGRADATIVVSTHEQSMLRELVPGATVHRIPILREPPTQEPGGWWRFLHRWLSALGSGASGVSPERPDPAGRRDVVFIGGYEHVPNVDAVLWFVREVWPLIRAKGFGQRFIIVGSKVPPKVAALAAHDIEVRGHVPDLIPLFGACRLGVAPLRYGGGIKGKIVTSFSHHVPVVATTIAAEGMELRHEEDILVADTPEAFAEQVIRLARDDALWRRLSVNGHRAFLEKFALSAGAPSVLAVFDSLMESRRAAPA